MVVLEITSERAAQKLLFTFLRNAAAQRADAGLVYPCNIAVVPRRTGVAKRQEISLRADLPGKSAKKYIAEPPSLELQKKLHEGT
ncbi:hypothetical protein [Kordiimonas sp.]|uniref:hypothetical protein n=1 Tax=Kordiimonas sp. TaxID=1970157 RepID=UPI003A8E5102